MATYILTDTGIEQINLQEEFTTPIRAYYLISDEPLSEETITLVYADTQKEDEELKLVESYHAPDDQRYYSLPYDFIKQIGKSDENYPSRVYLEYGVSIDPTMIQGANGYYALKPLRDFSVDMAVDNNNNSEFVYYENESDPSWVILLDVSEANYDTGVIDLHHILYDLSFSMPYAQSSPGGGLNNLISSKGATWSDDFQILLETEVIAATPSSNVENPTPSSSNFSSSLPTEIYIGKQDTPEAYQAIPPEVVGKYTLQPAEYFNMCMCTAEYYINENGYKLLIHAYTNEGDAPSNTHVLWDLNDYVMDQSDGVGEGYGVGDG